MMNAKPPRRGVPQPLQGGPQHFGPYLLQARLAVGGTSEVYLAQLAETNAPIDATQALLPPRFIVKRLLPHLVADAEGRTMFEREAELHAALSHRNVVTVFGSGLTDHGEPYLAMEYVDGCDAFRLLRRATQERATLPLGVCIHIAREALAGLAAVHDAKDAAGTPLGIIHRDVTPSNLYLSRTGEVKLGDFGIARSVTRGALPRPASVDVRPQDASLLGKYSYLSPEQVAGEPFDHRADLFSMATVLAELVIGKPLFPGTGQLQVLLAIRDCRLTPLDEARGRLPRDLVMVLEQGLAREPSARFQTAQAFSEALEPLAGDVAAAQNELAARVVSVQTVSSETQLAAVRESARAMRAVRIDSSLTPVVNLPSVVPVAPEPEADDIVVDEDLDASYENTGVYPQLESMVQCASGERLGPWTFAHLVEAIATGVVRPGDLVDYIGMGLRPVEQIPDLARLLPKDSTPPPRHEPSPALYVANLAETTMLDVLAYLLTTRQSGLLVIERPPGEDAPERREIYVLRGRLHHIASRNSSELLGQYLVRRGKIAKDELDLALAVLPRYGGRMGDTLIGLGLVDGVDIIRAIREQGRDGITELFLWRDGSVEFHPDSDIPAVDFPLDLELPALMLAGMEASHPGDAPMAFIEPRLDGILVPNHRAELANLSWPPVVAAVVEAVASPIALRDLLANTTSADRISGADVARALELLLSMDLVRWQD